MVNFISIQFSNIKHIRLVAQLSPPSIFRKCYFFFFFLFGLFVVVVISWAAPAAYGGSQARG